MKLTTETLVDMQMANLAAKVTADVKTRLAVLRSLRSSNRDAAIELLESLLDGDLMALGSLDPKDRPASAAGTLRVAAEYRSGYPHQIEDPVVDGYVKRALAIPFETAQRPVETLSGSSTQRR